MKTRCHSTWAQRRKSRRRAEKNPPTECAAGRRTETSLHRQTSKSVWQQSNDFGDEQNKGEWTVFVGRRRRRRSSPQRATKNVSSMEANQARVKAPSCAARLIRPSCTEVASKTSMPRETGERARPFRPPFRSWEANVWAREERPPEDAATATDSAFKKDARSGGEDTFAETPGLCRQKQEQHKSRAHWHYSTNSSSHAPSSLTDAAEELRESVEESLPKQGLENHLKEDSLDATPSEQVKVEFLQAREFPLPEEGPLPAEPLGIFQEERSCVENREPPDASLQPKAFSSVWTLLHVWLARPLRGEDATLSFRCEAELPDETWQRAAASVLAFSKRRPPLRLPLIVSVPASRRRLASEAALLEAETKRKASSCNDNLPPLRRSALTEALNPGVFAELREGERILFHLLEALDPWEAQTRVPPVRQVAVRFEGLAAADSLDEANVFCREGLAQLRRQWTPPQQQREARRREREAQRLMALTVWSQLLGRLQIAAGEGRCRAGVCCRCRRRRATQQSVLADLKREESVAFEKGDSKDGDEGSTASSLTAAQTPKALHTQRAGEALPAGKCCSGWRSLGRVSAETPDPGTTYLLQRCSLCALV